MRSSVVCSFHNGQVALIHWQRVALVNRGTVRRQYIPGGVFMKSRFNNNNNNNNDIFSF